MGIYDREYIRVGRRSTSGMGSVRALSLNTWLIIVNVAVFVLQKFFEAGGVMVQVTRYVPVPGTGQFVKNLVPMDPLTAFGHFSTYQGFQRLEVWRLVSFQFLHGGFWHIAMNMFGLFIFGGMVEQYLGRKRYLAFYLVCGVFGGIAYLVLNLMEAVLGIPLPGAFENPTMPLIGASAGVYGVIVAAAFIAPNAMVMLLFPPVPLKLKWLAYGYVALAAFVVVSGGPNAGGQAAHLGGAVAGYFFIRNAHLLRDFFDVFQDSRKPGGTAGRAGRARRERTPDVGEVDRILTKVREVGMHALTDGERRTLRRATEAERRKRGL